MVLALSGVFAAGWSASSASKRWTHAEPMPVALDAITSAGACIDPEAMAANANLVGQLHDVRSRVGRAAALETAAPKKADPLHPRIRTAGEDWSRMARERTVRLRLPCTNWSNTGRYGVVDGRSYGSSVTMQTASEVRRRATVSNLSQAELDTLSEVYGRAHARTWAAIRSTCEANAAYRKWIEELNDTHGDEPAPPPTDEARVQSCRAVLLDLKTDASRAAVSRVAELRAADASLDKANTDEQRVMHALTMSTTVLHDEMVKTLGAETTARALDHGVLCTHEIVLDARGPTPEPPPPASEEPEG